VIPYTALFPSAAHDAFYRMFLAEREKPTSKFSELLQHVPEYV